MDGVNGSMVDNGIVQGEARSRATSSVHALLVLQEKFHFLYEMSRGYLMGSLGLDCERDRD